MRKQNYTKTKRTGRAAAFTLLELLTVVSIIGILAAVGMPGLNNAMESAKASSAMQQARQIALGLRGYAADNGEVYPAGENAFGESINSSNAAFRDLFEYIEDEGTFAVKGSNWGAKADEKMKTPSDFLRPGENHFSYIAGLSTTSKPNWPLIVDGTDGKGTYTSDRSAKGGLRGGKRAVIVHCDGSGTVEKLGGEKGGDQRFLKRAGEPEENALEVSYMGSNVELLDPEG